MKFVHECKVVVWTFFPPKLVPVSPLGDVFSDCFLLNQSEFTKHLLEKGRNEIRILCGGKVLNMLSMPTRCIAQHAGLMGEQVKNDVSFFVIHQHFHPREVKTVLSKQVSENMLYLSTRTHSPIKKKCSEKCQTRLYFDLIEILGRLVLWIWVNALMHVIVEYSLALVLSEDINEIFCYYSLVTVNYLLPYWNKTYSYHTFL